MESFWVVVVMVDQGLKDCSNIKSLIFGDILTDFVYKLEHIMTILWNSMKIQEHRTF